MIEKNNMMVTVVVVTYNQEKWIRQTLDSILAQQTDYPFEIVIGEDFGTDGTRSICESYVAQYDNVRMAPNKQNKNVGVTANWLNCIANGTGKYIMSCAGDDYWHNPHKIQLQVDFMEAHSECVICHTDIDVLHENTGKIDRDFKKMKGIVPPEGRIQETVLSGREHMSAVTMCIRRDAFEKYIPADKFVELEFPREDWPTIIILSAHGDIRYLPISTATYRVGQESITNTLSYDKIRKRYMLDRRMTQFLYSMFPEWGPMDKGTYDYYDTYLYRALLRAAYQNNDYKSAKEFRKKDPMKRSATNLMARTWITFQILRIYRLLTC